MLIELLIDWGLLGSDCGLGSYFFPGHRVIGVIAGMIFTTGLYILLHSHREAKKMKRNGYKHNHYY